MKSPVIQVKNLSKSYRINHELQADAGDITLRDTIINIARKPYELFTGHIMKKEKFWALEDISFSVDQGDVVGIIGKNGSGKSTLLKILSRITEPTGGSAIMKGRVASLLEVGTGFHPELTGRENIYFNGAILGMTKKEIKSKFDEIVAFSEVEKFLDTPVKFYSSGMYVRLAFAVAAHLDPDILIIDEVLAVGDASFQRKCLNKMQDVAGQGRTVVFVSHTINLVEKLCNKGIMFSNGKIVAHGNIRDVINSYNDTLVSIEKKAVDNLTGLKVVSARVTSGDNLSRDEAFTAEVELSTDTSLPDCYVNFYIQDMFGTYVAHFQTGYPDGGNPSFNKGTHTVTISIPKIGLLPGEYQAFFRVFQDEESKYQIADSSPLLIKIKGELDDSGVALMSSKWSWKSSGQ